VSEVRKDAWLLYKIGKQSEYMILLHKSQTDKPIYL